MLMEGFQKKGFLEPPENPRAVALLPDALMVRRTLRLPPPESPERCKQDTKPFANKMPALLHD